MRAGHPLPTALGLVSREMPDPIGSEIGIVVDEVTYGIELEQALRNMAARTGHAELKFLVVAVNIQSKVGGNLAEILGNLSRLIRDRHRMVDKIRALSAEGRFSAALLSVLPLILAAIIHLMNPAFYGEVAADPLFAYGMGVGAVITVIGDYIMYRMVNFRI
jgi:tight adherence protein B